ncbi:MAG: thiamine pyrophosphate-binding protein, partial [Myxococcota bacterium]
MPLGDFLVAYLRKAGVTHLFGIPGDLILSLFHKFAGPRGLEIVTLSHEPGVGFAADGYARSTGKMGVLAVTYGAGGHNVVNPVAGSFSEEVPVLVISGGPGERELEPGRLIHHQAKDVESQHRIFREVTCATRVLEHPERAAEEIHDLVQTIQIERRPGYLEIHRDVVDVEISIPARIRQWDGSVPGVKSDPGAVSEAARETVARLNGAKRPIVIAGIEVHREGGGKALVRLAEALEVPVLTTVLSKGVFPMNHPLHFGVYCGRFSPEPIRRRTSASDLLLVLGALPTDLNLGPAPAHPNPGREIWAIGREVRVSRHTYTGVSLTSFLRALLRIGTLRPHEEKVRYVDNLRPPRNETRSPV